jgi:hypothetical protein
VVLLDPAVTVVVHPIDVDAHPSVPPGWRWAVMVGSGPPGELERCVNAGWCPTAQEAWLEGETVGATAVKALRAFGIPAVYGKLPLPDDPIPPGGDHLGAPV